VGSNQPFLELPRASKSYYRVPSDERAPTTAPHPLCSTQDPETCSRRSRDLKKPGRSLVMKSEATLTLAAQSSPPSEQFTVSQLTQTDSRSGVMGSDIGTSRCDEGR